MARIDPSRQVSMDERDVSPQSLLRSPNKSEQFQKVDILTRNIKMPSEIEK